MKTVIERSPETIHLIQDAHDRIRLELVDCVDNIGIDFENLHGLAFMRQWEKALKKWRGGESAAYARMVRRAVKSDYLQACKILGLEGNATEKKAA